MNYATLRYNIKAAFRQKAWFTALVSVAMLFALTVATVINAQSALRRALARGSELSLNDYFSYNDVGTGVVLMIAAFAAALVFFGYLHKPRQADFYHSLPISRIKLFGVNYIAGALAVVLPWLANLLLTVAILLLMGYGAYFQAGAIATGFAVQLLFFLGIYTFTVLAMTLTGHRLVGGLLALVIHGIGALGLSFYQWAGTTFYPTWYANLVPWDELMAHSSLAARYISLMGGNSQLMYITWGEALLTLLVIAAAAALSLWLYQKRPSERAGRALAFPVVRILVKYPLMLLSMMGMGLMLYEISDKSHLWFIIGAILGGAICAQIVEIVCAFDFGALRRRIVPLLIALAVFCGGSLFMLNDWGGYNSYVPDVGQVVKAEIVIDEGAGREYVALSFSDNMSAEEKTALYEQLYISPDGELQRGAVYSPAGIAATVSMAERFVAAYADQDSPRDYDRNRINATVRFTLADGSVKTRNYDRNFVYMADVAAELDAIYAEEDFRKGLYSLFDFEPQHIALAHVQVYEREDKYINFYDRDDTGEFTAPEGYVEDVSELLAAYEQELLQLTPAIMREAAPIGELELQVHTRRPMVQDIYGGGSPSRNYTYPLYAYMTDTLEALSRLENGAIATDIWTPRYDEAIEAMISYGFYDEKYGYGDYPVPAAMEYAPASTVEAPMGKSEMITDPDKIRELIEQSYPQQARNSYIERDTTRDLYVTYRDRYGEMMGQTRWFPLE